MSSTVINSDKDSLKRDRNSLVQVLMQAGATNTDRKIVRCPFHDDKHPSAEIKQAASGVWYFHCYVCDICDDVWALKARTENRPVSEVLKDANPYAPMTPQPTRKPVESFATIQDLIASYRQRNPQSKIEEINEYADPATGQADYATIRILPEGEGKKKFLQVSRSGEGWRYSGASGKLPLFNRTRIQNSDVILVVEGEKCVRFHTSLGTAIAATTSPGGAIAADKADWSPLAGKKVYVWRDNDEPGKRYEGDVIRELSKLEPFCQIYRVRVEELGLDEKGDIVDYLADESMTTAEKIASFQLVLFDAEPLNATSALEKKFAKIAAGDFRAIAFPQMPRLSENSKAISPGTITTVCGDPGTGKSFWSLENFWRWIVQKNETAKLLMLEDDPAMHQNRVLAQMSGEAELLDPDFVAENSETVQSTFAAYRDDLETFSRHLETASDQMTLAEIADWVINHAENGIRIIGVDPITAAKASDKPWIDDQTFLFRVKPVLERTGASLLLTTHPRMGQAGKPSLSGMAGGASYPRFSQCVLWLKNFESEQSSEVWDGYLRPTVKHRQILQIRKARNGKGQGKNLAVNLNFQNLCFDELGVIESRAGKSSGE